MLLRRRDGVDLPDAMTMPGSRQSMTPLLEFVSAHAREIGFSVERIRDINVGIEEALHNIIDFACVDGMREIMVTCNAHEMGALLVDILDSGKPFNMLVASTFPEAADFTPQGRKPSTSMMKKTMKDIEYRRDGKQKKNILSCVISK